MTLIRPTGALATLTLKILLRSGEGEKKKKKKVNYMNIHIVIKKGIVVAVTSCVSQQCFGKVTVQIAAVRVQPYPPPDGTSTTSTTFP
jgi:hypothetical protein